MEKGSTQNKPALKLNRTYAVSPEKVWNAWTDPQALTKWFGPGEPSSVTLADMDVRAGGHYRIAFKTQDGQEHKVSGIYREVVENRKLVFSWAWQSTPERVSLVTVALRPVDGGTELSFLHEGFFDEAARDSHHGGWSGTFAKLDALLPLLPLAA
ncbi:MAG TPA: SRPBCC domain-containing protein [Burkholderiaceae bacterium]|nr:SRPBCC domain-containing protein [Burkholderiaceae bacterium]